MFSQVFVCPREVSVSGGSVSGGSVSGGVCVQEGLCPGGSLSERSPHLTVKSGQYASYWNAFLLQFMLSHGLLRFSSGQYLVIVIVWSPVSLNHFCVNFLLQKMMFSSITTQNFPFRLSTITRGGGRVEVSRLDCAYFHCLWTISIRGGMILVSVCLCIIFNFLCISSKILQWENIYKEIAQDSH